MFRRMIRSRKVFHAVSCITAIGALGAASLTAAAASPAHAVDKLSIYTGGAAIVFDQRSVDLKQGDNTLHWPIAGQADPSTFWLANQHVELQSVGPVAGPPQSKDPLARRIGKKVLLTRGGTSKTVRKHGVLRAVNGDTAYVDSAERTLRITPASPWQMSWPSDESEQSGPSLPAMQLLVKSRTAGRTKLGVIYQLGGISWHASTTGSYDDESGQLVFHSVAVVHNGTNAAVRAAHAGLIAGRINRAGSQHPGPVVMAAARQSNASQPAPRAAGHGYRYAITGGVKLGAGQTRALRIVGRTQVQAKRRYVVTNRFDSQYAGADQRHANVVLQFNNPAGAPLPAGAFRVYSAAHPATLLGADHIGNTPAGAPVKLDLGRAFNVTGTRRITHSQKAGTSQQRTVVITLKNAGQNLARVSVEENLPNNARIVSASQPAARKTSGKAHWQANVKPGHSSRIRYSVRWPVNG